MDLGNTNRAKNKEKGSSDGDKGRPLTDEPITLPASLGIGKKIGRNRREKKKRVLHARSQGGKWTIGRLCMQLWHIIQGFENEKQFPRTTTESPTKQSGSTSTATALIGMDSFYLQKTIYVHKCIKFIIQKPPTLILLTTLT